MTCCLGALALVAPRMTILLVVLFSDTIGTAYATRIVPVLGFFFLPVTTLAYAWALHRGPSVSGFSLVVVILAVLVDLGILGGYRAGMRGGLRRRRGEGA